MLKQAYHCSHLFELFTYSLWTFRKLTSYVNVNDNNSSPKGDAEFVQFYTMEYGWRAAFVILCRTYFGKYGLKTIRDIVSRWAPAKENNTEAYIRHVSDYTGIAPNNVLGSPQEHPTQWLLIGYAMAVVENGKALSAVPMLKGICPCKSTLTLTQKVLEMISGTFFVTTFIASFFVLPR